MKRIVFVLMVLMVFVGCNHIPNSSNINSSIIEVDSVALKDSLFKVDLIKNEGVKAIGNIDFFISEKEFNQQKEIFLRPLIHTISLGSVGSYTSGYKLGEYKFYHMNGNFFNDSLFNVHIIGDKISYDEYSTLMPKQYESLLSILTEKYGFPNEKKELPDWSYMSNNSTLALAKWNLGFKKLFVFINCFGVNYRLDFCYYVTEMEDRKNKFEEEELKNTNQKAAEKL